MRGFTVPDLASALAVAGVLALLAVPPVREGLDRVGADAARNAAQGVLARTRAVSLARGGAVFVLVPDSALLRIEAGTGSVVEALDLGREYGVAVEASGRAGAVRLRYDALGIGRMASRTLLFRRGEATATLVVSSYGRVVRR